MAVDMAVDLAVDMAVDLAVDMPVGTASETVVEMARPEWLAVLLAAVAGWIGAEGRGTVAARRLSRWYEVGSGPGPPTSGGPLPGSDPMRAVYVGGCAVLGVLVGVAVGSPVPVALGAPAGLAFDARRRRLARDREACAWRAAVIELCADLAAELRAGRPPRTAFDRAVEFGPQPLRVLAEVSADADVAGALKVMSERPGAEGLRRVAVCWQVAEGTGAGLAVALDRLAAGMRAEEAQRREIDAQLAGPRATVSLLGGLPLVGLFIGAGLGGDPVGVLLGTPLGLFCLGLGLILDLTGLAWAARIAGRAERGV